MRLLLLLKLNLLPKSKSSDDMIQTASSNCAGWTISLTLGKSFLEYIEESGLQRKNFDANPSSVWIYVQSAASARFFQPSKFTPLINSHSGNAISEIAIMAAIKPGVVS
jgi:hypothetical protein